MADNRELYYIVISEFYDGSGMSYFTAHGLYDDVILASGDNLFTVAFNARDAWLVRLVKLRETGEALPVRDAESPIIRDNEFLWSFLA